MRAHLPDGMSRLDEGQTALSKLCRYIEEGCSSSCGTDDDVFRMATWRTFGEQSHHTDNDESCGTREGQLDSVRVGKERAAPVLVDEEECRAAEGSSREKQLNRAAEAQSV